jgi:hypothetical protein
MILPGSRWTNHPESKETLLGDREQTRSKDSLKR